MPLLGTALLAIKIVLALCKKDSIGVVEELIPLMEELQPRGTKNYEEILKTSLEKVVKSQREQIAKYAGHEGEVQVLSDNFIRSLHRKGCSLTDDQILSFDEGRVINVMIEVLEESLIIPGHRLDSVALQGICRMLMEQVRVEVKQCLFSNSKLSAQVIVEHCDRLHKNLDQVNQKLNELFHLEDLSLQIQCLKTEILQRQQRNQTIEEFLEEVLQKLRRKEFKDENITDLYMASVESLIEEFETKQMFIDFMDSVELSRIKRKDLNFDEYIKVFTLIINRLATIKIVYPLLKPQFERWVYLSQDDTFGIAYIYPEEEEEFQRIALKVLRYFAKKNISTERLQTIIIENCYDVVCTNDFVRGASIEEINEVIMDISTVQLECKEELTAMPGRYDFRYHCKNHIAIRDQDTLKTLTERLKAIVEGVQYGNI